MPSMQSCSLPLANVITVVQTEAGKPLLIGLGGAAYDSSPEASEALINTHHLKDNGVLVDDKAKVHGGGAEDYSLWFSYPIGIRAF